MSYSVSHTESFIHRSVEVLVEGYPSSFFAVSFRKLRLFFEADKDLHVILDQFRSKPDGVLRLDRSVCPNLQRQLVIIGILTQASGFDVVVDLLDRRMNRVDRDVPDRQVFVVVPLRGDVTASAFQTHLDNKRSAFRDRRYMDIRIQDLDFGVGLDLARQHLAGHAAFDPESLRSKSVQLKRDSL